MASEGMEWHDKACVCAIICRIYCQSLICQPRFVINRVDTLYVLTKGDVSMSNEYSENQEHFQNANSIL
jgi:hypothetical protein